MGGQNIAGTGGGAACLRARKRQAVIPPALKGIIKFTIIDPS